MGSHLRDLIESVNKNGPIYPGDMSPLSIELAYSYISKHAEDAICFDAGPGCDFDDVKVIDGLVRLPYGVCWIEVSGPSSTLVGCLYSACGTDVEPQDMGQIWAKINRQWEYLCTFTQFHGSSEIVVLPDWSPRLTEDALGDFINIFRSVLCVLNCRNIQKVKHDQPAKLQKSREKKGKKPLFSYWTLHVGEHASHGGETREGHASPRLHLRRGHFREYQPGKYCWVQACAVGRKENGMIHKDYSMGVTH